MSIQEIKLQIICYVPIYSYKIADWLDHKRYTISHIFVNNTSYKLPALLLFHFNLYSIIRKLQLLQ